MPSPPDYLSPPSRCRCSSRAGRPPPEPQDNAADEAEARELGRDTDKTVLDDMIQTQDRARAVEDVTMDAKRNLDEAIDAQTGDASDESGDD